MPAVIFALLALLIAAAGMIGFQQYHRQVRQAVERDLYNITDAKIRQFSRWVEERKRDSRALVTDQGFRGAFDAWCRNGQPSDERKKHLQQRLRSMRDAYGYEDILLFDRSGAKALSTDAEAISPSSVGMNLVEQVLRTGRMDYADIHYLRRDGSEHVRIGILAPIRQEGAETAKPIGVALLRIDPTLEMFPAIETWPWPTASGETFLAKHEGDTIVILSQVRHPPANAAALRFSVSNEKLLAAQTARGQGGVISGEDYRGVPVLGATSLIEGTSWLIVTKIDKEEVYAPIRRTGWLVGVVVLGFLGVAGLVTAVWWGGQRNLLVAKIAESRLHHALAEQRLSLLSQGGEEAPRKIM